MKKPRNRLCVCCLSALFFVGMASASPEMAAAAEDTSSVFTALSLQNVQSLPASASEPLKLTGFFTSWSEVFQLNTGPFVGLLIKVL